MAASCTCLAGGLRVQVYISINSVTDENTLAIRIIQHDYILVNRCKLLPCKSLLTTRVGYDQIPYVQHVKGLHCLSWCKTYSVWRIV